MEEEIFSPYIKDGDCLVVVHSYGFVPLKASYRIRNKFDILGRPTGLNSTSKLLKTQLPPILENTSKLAAFPQQNTVTVEEKWNLCVKGLMEVAQSALGPFIDGFH